MSIKFNPTGHKYSSTDSENINWRSVTSLVSMVKEKFDAELMAKKCSKNAKSKWYGYTAKEILEFWRKESEQAMDLGHFYHEEREKDLTEFDTIVRKDKEVPIIRPIVIDGVKHSPNQKLEDGVYPEHMVLLKSAGICGQSDRVEVIDGIVDICDYKTNKEIRTEGFRNWEGIPKMLHSPVSHLEDCELNHYSIQLSFYMYIILKHNPKLRPGTLTIEHVIFEEEGRDKLNNRIIRRDEQGHPVVKEVVRYKVPYLKDEVISIINWLHETK